ncbi:MULTISPECIES: hypothetical protein [Methylobacter]
MDKDVLVRLKRAFEHLEGKAASNQDLNCGDWVMIGMAIDLISHELKKPDDAFDRPGLLDELLLVSCNESLDKLSNVEKAVKKYYLALDKREHGGIAETQAFDEIQQVLGMSWQQGEALNESQAEESIKHYYR